MEPRRRVEKHWFCKQWDVQHRSDEKMECSKAEKQPPRCQIMALYKQNRPSLPFIWICIQVYPHKSSRKCQKSQLNVGPKLKSLLESCVRFFLSMFFFESCVQNHLTLPGKINIINIIKCWCDSDQCSEQESDHIRLLFCVLERSMQLKAAIFSFSGHCGKIYFPLLRYWPAMDFWWFMTGVPSVIISAAKTANCSVAAWPSYLSTCRFPYLWICASVEPG